MLRGSKKLDFNRVNFDLSDDAHRPRLSSQFLTTHKVNMLSGEHQLLAQTNVLP